MSPSALASYEISPSVITRGTPFSVTARVYDESPVFLGVWNGPRTGSITFNGSGYANTCDGVTLTPVSATESEVAFSCDGSWIGLVGPLMGRVTAHLVVQDALYNTAALPLTINFGPAA